MNRWEMKGSRIAPDQGSWGHPAFFRSGRASPKSDGTLRLDRELQTYNLAKVNALEVEQEVSLATLSAMEEPKQL